MKKIFIVHGWTYTTEKWNNLADKLKAGGFEPVQLTVPGLTEATDRVWTLEDYVSWLKDKLENEDKPILIGHSNGGRIALAFAAQYPDKLGRLILIGSAGIFHNELPIRIKRLAFGTAARIGKKFTSSEFLRKILYKLAGEKDYKNANPQMRQTMSNLITVDLTDRLPSVITPTLIIWGENDKMTPLSDGKLMNSLIKNSKLYIVKNAGHSPHFTNTDEVAAQILKELSL